MKIYWILQSIKSIKESTFFVFLENKGDDGRGSESDRGHGGRHRHLLQVADVLQGEGRGPAERNLPLVHESRAEHGEAELTIQHPDPQTRSLKTRV